MEDRFTENYDASELKIAAEFLTNWLPFLTKGLCETCVATITDRIASLDQGKEENPDQGDTPASTSIGSNQPKSSSPKLRKSWADMAQEDELEMEARVENDKSHDESSAEKISSKTLSADSAEKNTKLTREQRERIRFTNVVRKADFICLERVGDKIKNILDGLELHSGVFSAAEQKRIVGFVLELQEKGRKGELGEWTYSEPKDNRRDRQPATIQFGCCVDEKGNLKNVIAESIPPLFKVIIRRLIRWHILPPSCIPDCCIVHVFKPGNFIPPRIESQDFLRPFCTVSFLNECSLLFGSSGSSMISLPVGSAFVMNGNGANITMHCMDSLPTKRISITFKRMDESRRPSNFDPEPDLQSIQPLSYDDQAAKKKIPRRRKPSRVVVDARSTAGSSIGRQRVARNLGDNAGSLTINI